MEEFINKRSRNSSGRNSKRNGISILSFIIVIVGFFMLYRPAPKTDAGTEVIKTYREIQSVPENSTEKGSSTVSNLTPKDVQTLQELKEEIELQCPIRFKLTRYKQSKRFCRKSAATELVEKGRVR